MSRRIMKLAVGSLVSVAFVAGLVAMSTPAQAVIRICICPDVYAPVKCSNGRTYSNSCVASCNHATGCVPTGNI